MNKETADIVKLRNSYNLDDIRKYKTQVEYIVKMSKTLSAYELMARFNISMPTLKKILEANKN